MPTITPSLLYDYLQCPHKVWRDVHGPKHELVDEDNPFLKLLWERGVRHEKDTIAAFAHDFVDCSQGTEMQRIEMTNAALADRAEYIYQGILAHGDLFGIPDLLHWDGAEYYPVEIKSGTAEEGGDDAPGKLKKHYAVQLALYCEILNRRGLNSSRKGFVIDITGERFEYDLTRPQGTRTPETYWEMFLRMRYEVNSLLLDETRNEPAMCGACKMCGWYHSCKEWCEREDDLTRLFYVGRSVRDVIKRDLETSRVADLVHVDRDIIVTRKKSDKSFLKGIGAQTIEKMVFRAELMITGSQPHIHEPHDFPDASTELFFDIEADPTQDFIYLHGFWVRDGRGQRFVEFTARDCSPEAERRVWSEAIDFIRSHDLRDTAIYYYSPYERVSYRRLGRKHPDVIAESELDQIFTNENVIDLYEVVMKKTDWPLGSYGIKAIAQYLNFSWRDETPSGALSIQWYNDYLATRDEKYLTRVLEYNEDDCRATMVVKDYLKQRMTEA